MRVAPTTRGPASRGGKDVYWEGARSWTGGGGRQGADVARKDDRGVQTGSQQGSGNRFRLACELVRSGKIGKVKEVLVGIPGVNYSTPPVPVIRPFLPAILLPRIAVLTLL